MASTSKPVSKTSTASKDNAKKGKGQGPHKVSKKGKALAKKSEKKEQVNREDQLEDSVVIEDDENCCVCCKFQPEGLHIDLALKLVQWAQCDVCLKWVHLKFCTDAEEVSDSDTCHCPKCKSN